MKKDSLMHLSKEDFDVLKFPKGLRDTIYFDLHKGKFELFQITC